MFNLETAIAEWRQQMRAAGIKSPVPLEELENHLLEEIEREMQSGTSDERAFDKAVQKIGLASALKAEFKKVDAARKARVRLNPVIRLGERSVKLLFLLSNLMALMACFPALFKWGDLSQMTSGQHLSCLAAAATFTLLIWSGRLGYRLFPVIRSGRTRDLIGGLVAIPVVLWWIVSVFLILPRCDFTVDQLFVVFIWGFFTPSGVLLGLALGMETSARKKGAMAVS